AALESPAGGDFLLYELPPAADWRPQQSAAATFAEELDFLGYDIVEGCVTGQPCTLATYWRVIAPPVGPRRLFLHAVDGRGELLAQDDRLGAPAAHWPPNDVV